MTIAETRRHVMMMTNDAMTTTFKVGLQTRGKTQRHDAKEKPRRGTSGGWAPGLFPGMTINQQ